MNREKLEQLNNEQSSLVVLDLIDLLEQMYEKYEEDLPELIKCLRVGTEKYVENNRYETDKYTVYIAYFIKRLLER